MKCPACERQLSNKAVGTIEVDTCENGCGGIWFDQFEFKKFDEPHETAGVSLLDISVDPDISVDHAKKRHCPKCNGITMMRHFYSVKKQVEIDECPSCGGIWLDSGELKQIRGMFDTEAEKQAAAKACFDDLFGPQLEQLEAKREQDKAKARRIANMFKFICPSYYIPGDQKWGAF